MNWSALTSLFRKLGARDPEQWAGSQLSEGIPQLERFLFLRQAWRLVLTEDRHDWIKQTIEQSKRHPKEPYAGAGHALDRLTQAGASDQDLTDLVRAMQAELLFGLCYLLEDPGLTEPEVESVTWWLFRTNEEGEPVAPISGLHESVLETDPTGREMRPK